MGAPPPCMFSPSQNCAEADATPCRAPPIGGAALARRAEARIRSAKTHKKAAPSAHRLSLLLLDTHMTSTGFSRIA